MGPALPLERPLRLGVVGLGQISELVLPAYLRRRDVEIVGLCDPDAGRLRRWAGALPEAVATARLGELLASGPDVIDVLVPTPLHGDVVTEVLEAGVHVQVQKPIARDLAAARRMLEAAEAGGLVLGVLEDYRCYPPLVRLKEIVDSGEIGAPAGAHLKIVANGRGGWEVPPSSYRWQFEQALDGRGMLVFDHGWHQLAIATWLFGRVQRVFGWVGRTEVVPGIVLDAPSTLVWEHENGVRVVLEIVFAPDMYFRSDYYTGDERVEVTGTRGFVRCNRISARGIQEPSVVVYRDGEIRAAHALADDPPDAFDAMAARSVAYFTGDRPDQVMDGREAEHVLAALLAGLASSDRGLPMEVAELEAQSAR